MRRGKTSDFIEIGSSEVSDWLRWWASRVFWTNQRAHRRKTTAINFDIQLKITLGFSNVGCKFYQNFT